MVENSWKSVPISQTSSWIHNALQDWKYFFKYFKIGNKNVWISDYNDLTDLTNPSLNLKFKHLYFLYICGFWIRSEQKSGRIHTFAAISLNKMTFLNALFPFSIRIPRKLWVSGVCVLPRNKKKRATTDGACVVHTFGLSANVRRPRDKRKSCTHMSIRGYDVYESF